MQNNLPTQRQQIIGVFLGFCGAVLFSTKAIFVKIAYTYGINAVTLLLFRMLFSLPIYIGIAVYIFKNKKIPSLSTKQYLQIAFLGVLGYYVSSLFDFLGLYFISASLERLILFIYPTLVVLIGVFFFKEKITKAQILALILTYLGIIVIFSGNIDTDNQKNMLFGSLLVFACSVTFAFYLVGSGVLLPKVGTWGFTSLAMIASTAAIVLHQFISHKGIGNLVFPSEVYWISFAMATLSTVIPTLMTSESIRLIGASRAAVMATVGPVSTIIMAYFFLEERLTILQIIGGLLIVSGVVFVSLLRQNIKNTNK